MSDSNVVRWVVLIKLPSGKIVMREIKNVIPFRCAVPHANEMAWTEMGEVVSMQAVNQWPS